MSVDESMYSVAMASARFTGSSFHCEGRPGVILGSPKEQFILRAGAYATYAALMESLCEGLGLLWVGQEIFAIHD